MIWDAAGNHWEWTTLSFGANKPWVAADGDRANDGREFANLDAGFGVVTKGQLIPTNALTGFWNDAWDSNNGVGRYTAGNNTNGSGPRGESFNTNPSTNSGFFALYLVDGANTSYSDWGFRCVVKP